MTENEIERWYLGLPFDSDCIEQTTAPVKEVSDECAEDIFLDLASVVPA